MPTDAAKNLTTQIENALNQDMDRALHMEWETLSFAECEGAIKRTLSLLRKVQTKELDEIPPKVLNDTANKIHAFNDALDRMVNAKIDSQGFSNERQNIINEIKNPEHALFQVIARIIAVQEAGKAESIVGKIQSELDDQLESSRREFRKIVNDIEEIKMQAESALGTVRESAVESVVAVQARHFQKQAVKHEQAARRSIWCAAGGMFLLLDLMVLSIVIHRSEFFIRANEHYSTYDAIQLGISKILIFGVLSSIIFVAVRNYLSNSHNAVVNKHRENALLTYRALAESVDDDNRNAIIMHAASCIFSPQPTAFLSGHDDGTSITKSVIEMSAKGMSKGATT